MYPNAGILCLLGLFLVSDTDAQKGEIFWKSDDLKVYVIDKVFNNAKQVIQQTIKTLGETNWKFTVDESFLGHESQVLRMGFATRTPGVMQSLAANKLMRKLVSSTYGYSKAILTEAQGRMLERGDFNPVISRCFGNTSKVMAILTLSKKWKKNDYGEITIYDKNADVLRSIFPRFGRVLLIPCGVHFKISPPSINVERRHYFLISEFGDKHDKLHSESSEEMQSLTSYFKTMSKTGESGFQKIDPEKFVTRKFYTHDGKKIFVYDNVFPMASLQILHDYIMNHAEYYESPVFEKDSSDNVKWIISLDDPDFVDGPIWNISTQLLTHIAGQEFFPYDLACNHVRRTDNTFTHKDNYEDADEYTVLIYLNQNWTENDYGETSFLQDNEIVAALRPRYGRVVIFHGTIDHSAHPSSPELSGARYTFAIKTASTRELASSRVLESEASLSYSDVLTKLTGLESSGDAKLKNFAKNAIDILRSGRIPDGKFIKKLQNALKL